MNNIQRNFKAKASLQSAKGVVHGPGTTTSDSVNVKASKGEAILPAKTVQAVGGPKAIHHLIKNTTGKAPKVGLRAGAKYSVGEIPDISDVGIKKIDAVPRPNVATSSSPFPQTGTAPAAAPIDPTMKIPDAGAPDKSSLFSKVKGAVGSAKDAVKTVATNVTGAAGEAAPAMDRLSDIGNKAHTASEIADDLKRTGDTVLKGGKTVLKGAGNTVARAVLPLVGETAAKINPVLQTANAVYDIANDPNVIRGSAQGALDVATGLSGVAGLPVALADVGSRLATGAIGAEINGRGMGLAQLADDAAPWQVGKVAAAKGLRDLREDATMKGIKGDIDFYRSMLSRSAVGSPAQTPQSVQQAISPSEAMTDHNPNPPVPAAIKDRFYSDGKPPSLVPATTTPGATTPSSPQAASLTRAITAPTPQAAAKTLPANFLPVDNAFTRAYSGIKTPYVSPKGETLDTQIALPRDKYNPMETRDVLAHNLTNSRNIGEYLTNKSLLRALPAMDANMASREASANTLQAAKVNNERALTVMQRDTDIKAREGMQKYYDTAFAAPDGKGYDTKLGAEFRHFVDSSVNGLDLGRVSEPTRQALLADMRTAFMMAKASQSIKGSDGRNVNRAGDATLTTEGVPSAWASVVSPSRGSLSKSEFLRRGMFWKDGNELVNFGGNIHLRRDLEESGGVAQTDQLAAIQSRIEALRKKAKEELDAQGSK